jgi:ArsR family transcriptional regulator
MPAANVLARDIDPAPQMIGLCRYHRCMPMTKQAKDAAVAAKLFRGFGDATRLAILISLAAGEKRVTDLVAELRMSQANVSGHVACLRDCGLVDDRPEGRQVFYRVAATEVFDLLQAAEQLLAASGHRIKLCPRYEQRRHR